MYEFQVTPHFPIVHLAVDSYAYHANQLQPELGEEILTGTRNFADDIRPFGIPTISIASGKQQKIFASPAAWSGATPHGDRPTTHLVRDTSHMDSRAVLAGMLGTRDDEDIFVKDIANALGNRGDEPNATGGNLLVARLKLWNTRILLVTGMHTGECISDTIYGAMRNGFLVHVIRNRLGDHRAMVGQAEDTAWHEKRIRGTLYKEQGVEFFTDSEYTALLREAPVLTTRPPLRALMRYHA